MSLARRDKQFSIFRPGGNDSLRAHRKSLATVARFGFAVLLAFPAILAHADSGAGVDTSLGNALNPAGTSRAREPDPVRLGIEEFTRSPSGFLVTWPNLPAEVTKFDSGWLQSGSIEVGGLGVGGDWRTAKFREYKDLDRNGYVNNFVLQRERPDGAYFIDAIGGGVGHDDQYYGLSFGRYNDWKVKTFYNETPHVFTSTYRSLWRGVGSDTLVLNGLPPGGVTNALVTEANIGNAVLQTPTSTLSLIRKKGGVRVDMKFLENWNAYASYTSENRKGARPFGLASGGGGGTGGVEVPESINYDTHDFLAGLQYSDTLGSLNLSVASSLFRNNINTLTIDNPMFVFPANNIAQFPRAVFDLYPNNDFYNAKAEYARSLPEFYRGHFTALISASSSRQNDNLVPSTPYPGAAVNGVTGGGWDTVASLSKQTAGARIDSTLADFTLSLKPAAGFDLKGKIRLYETRNGLEYLACNPLTGQWGRFINDGSADAIINTPAYLAPGVRCNIAATAALGIAPGAGDSNIRSIPFEYKQRTYALGADYRLGKAASIGASYEREELDRAFRERATTNEDKVKLTYVNRALESGTLRISLESDRRRGSAYLSDPYSSFYSVSLGPLPSAAFTPGELWIRTNNLQRKYDLADRDQNVLNARFNYALAPDMDMGMSLQAKDIKYPDSQYGRNDRQRLDSANIDLNWQPAANSGLYASVSYQAGKMHQAGVQPNDCTIGGTYYFLSNGSVQSNPLTPPQIASGLTIVATQTVPASSFQSLCGSVSPTSPLFPSSHSWDVSHRDKNYGASLGGHVNFAKARLDVSVTLANATTAIHYGYNAAALGISAAEAGLIGDGFPDLTFRTSTLESNLVVPFSSKVSLRFLLRHEIGRIRDWHYDGVAQNPAPNFNQPVFLDAGPQNYKASAVGVFLAFAL